jgi:HK97 family phage major capsid protein
MGFPVTEAEDMPDIASNAFAIAVGDFRAGYLVVDRMGVRVLRDPYSAKPYVLLATFTLLRVHPVSRESEARNEPRRVCRRPFGLSYAAMAGASSIA